MLNISGRTAVRLVLWLLIVLVLAFLKWEYHEMWKDEWQAWFVAKDMGIGQILSFLYYEGHPALWYLFLKPFTWLPFDQFTLLSAAHLLTIGGALYFLMVKFRTPLWLCLLFSLTYFVFFEYGLISRGYALVMMLALWTAVLVRDARQYTWEAALVLFLLCQTEVFGVLMALAFSFYLFITTDDRKVFLLSNWTRGLLAGLTVFVASVFPRSTGHIGRTGGTVMPVTDHLLSSLQGNLSNTFMPGTTPDTFRYGWTLTGLALSVVVLAGLWYYFRSDRKLGLTMALMLAMMTGFSFFIFLGGIRQWGMGFVFFICLTELLMDKTKPGWKLLVVPALFSAFGVIHGFRAVREDIRIPFTNAREAGLFIRDKVPPKVPVVALNKFESTPVIGYAGRKFYELPDGKEFSYFRWVDKVYVPTEEELRLFGRYRGVGGIILLSPRPIDTLRYPAAMHWKTFAAPSYKNENYYLYSLPVK